MSVSAGSARAVDPHAGPGLAPPRTAVATICLSGSLEDKLAAAAGATHSPSAGIAPFPCHRR